jgi:hypothetical protein
MVGANPNKDSTAGNGVPQGVYDPYKALINALPLPDDIVQLLTPAFDPKGFPLEFDPNSVTDFGKNPLPHYKVETDNGKIVLIHVGDEVASNDIGRNQLMTVTYSFLNAQSIALFIFSEADSFDVNTEALIDTWQGIRPTLKVCLITHPLIQQLKVETDSEKRMQNIRGLLGLDDLLVRNQATLDQKIEAAYQQARLDLLDNLKGLPDRLNDADRDYVCGFLAELALYSPGSDPKVYLINLVKRLGLSVDELSILIKMFGGNASSDSKDLVMSLEEKTYPRDPPVDGYKRVLGYMLSILADEGGGKKIALIIFKYRLVAKRATLEALVAKYP